MATLTVTSPATSSALFPVSFEGALVRSEEQMQKRLSKACAAMVSVNTKALDVQEVLTKRNAQLQSALATVEARLIAAEVANKVKLEAAQKAELAQKERADALQTRVKVLEDREALIKSMIKAMADKTWGPTPNSSDAVTCHRFAMVRLVEPSMSKLVPAASRCDQHRMREAFGVRKSSFALLWGLFGIKYFDRSGDMI